VSESDFHNKISEELGYIKARVERIPDIDARLLRVENKVSRILGYASGFGAAAGLTFTFIKEWFLPSNRA